MVAIDPFLAHQFEVGPNAWLIAYDIRDPRRLARVHRLLRSVAFPLQYSVFLGWIKRPELEELVTRLKILIELKQDDVRLYHLPARIHVHVLGKKWLPEGVSLYQHGKPSLLMSGDMGNGILHDHSDKMP